MRHCLYKNDVIVLPKELLKKLKHLKSLDLGKNQINSLDGNLLNETKNLTRLTLDYNNLVHLANTLFRGLTLVLLRVFPEHIFLRGVVAPLDYQY